MLKQVALIILIFYILICCCNSSLSEDIVSMPDDFLTNSLETSLYCRGSLAVNNIINNLSKTDKPVVILRGLEIVPTTTNGHNNTADNGATGVGEGNTDDTILGHISYYLRTHELNIKFSDLMSSDESRFLARNLEQSGMQMNPWDEARKKDKGNGWIIALGLMMSKMMAVIGLGGIGALAMKALGVSMTALMMAAMVGVKSLAQEGHESSHSVQYVTADGHHHKSRRRRSSSNNYNNIITGPLSSLSKEDDVKLQLPSLIYREWQNY